MAEISKRYNKDDPITREEVRRTFYKTRIRKDNIRLELDEDKSQEERRRLLLEFQKKYTFLNIHLNLCSSCIE
jgi:hypothetical protein